MFLLLKWLVFSLIVIFTAWLIPGISVENFTTALLVAIVIGLVNISIKPVLMFITLPINIFTLGIFALVINALLLMFIAYLVPGFEVDGFLSAFFGAILMSILSIGLSFI